MSVVPLHRPIYGGPFGKGRYAMLMLPTTRDGDRHLVVDSNDGRVISVAPSKLEALAGARAVLKATELLVEAESSAHEQAMHQQPLFPPEAFQQPPVRQRARPVSRRRRDVYSKCGGRCVYCSAPLQLDGSWHVDHALPRALGGLNDIGNLFAACAPCNLAKRDRTGLEFMAEECGAAPPSLIQEQV